VTVSPVSEAQTSSAAIFKNFIDGLRSSSGGFA
jgi:hypothetical protein